MISRASLDEAPAASADVNDRPIYRSDPAAFRAGTMPITYKQMVALK